MASGLTAGITTPHRTNLAYQAMIDSGPSIILEMPTESIAITTLQQTGRIQQAPLINRPTGLETSIHAQADNDATTALKSIWNEVQRRQDAKRAMLSLVTRSLDNIVASCRNDLKETAKEVTGLFSTFLTSVVWTEQAPPPKQLEANLIGRDAPQNWAAAAAAGCTSSQPEPQTRLPRSLNADRGYPRPRRSLGRTSKNGQRVVPTSPCAKRPAKRLIYR